ncbi:scoloptoxin SSD14-like isoform X2 [Penaeus chinensis]|uniref:scoloptoxin SSD14-like isoform X2 n=1 Tax=Penaeus chinensis TaxID=139456 RepID=UPI001FB6E57D|nr:scoloptoxin SSD14-like isoform X2 [Penaeus chinensis]
MGRKSKRLRAQLYQYACDEAGSYSNITDWNPPIPPPGRPAIWAQLSKKQLITCVVLVVCCVGAIAVGLGIGLPRLSSEPTVKQESKPPLAVAKPAPPRAQGQFESWGEHKDGSYYEATEPPPSETELGEFHKAAVSADGTPCAQIATDILKRNGSAADAAVAGLFCVGVINTQSMGLGGGFLMTYYDHSTRKAYSLNARESAPMEAYEDMYDGNGELAQKAKGKWWASKDPSLKGGLAVAVPGELRGYRELYDRFGGNLPWAELLEPTIKLCEEGHLVNWHMARALKFNADDIKKEPSMSVFINPETGEVYKEGDTLKRPQLAKTLRDLQEDPDALYSGHLAAKLAQDIQSFGGIVTEEDLRMYKPVWKEAMNITLQHGQISMFSVPPPGSGLILGFILNILDEYGLTPESINDPNIVLTHHRITEAMKWAYAKRTELGDADFVDMTELAKNLTSDDNAAYIHSQITDDRTFQDPEHYGAFTADPDDHGTAHFSLLAPNGDAISVTSTVNLYFGAGIRSVQTGIVLNDEMDDFSAPNITNYFGIPPSPANFIRPGKRPLSSMCPAVFVDSMGDVRLIIGAAGGTKISSGVAWASLRNLWLGDNIKEAVDARRIHHQLFPMTFSYEQGILPKIVEGLTDIGHITEEFGVGGSVICAIARGDDGKIYANSDFRKAGEVDGF